MYCPRCGQQQVSEETKFCSRCGFSLGLVSEILAHGGFLPQLAEIYKDKKFFSRRNGLIFALFWFLFFCTILTPFAAITNADSEIIAVFALIGSMGALLITVASFLLLQGKPKNKHFFSTESLPNPQSNQFFQNPPQTNQSALPPHQEQNYVPPKNVWKSYDTGDLVPRSVTENTTKLLEKDK